MTRNPGEKKKFVFVPKIPETQVEEISPATAQKDKATIKETEIHSKLLNVSSVRKPKPTNTKPILSTGLALVGSKESAQEFSAQKGEQILPEDLLEIPNAPKTLYSQQQTTAKYIDTITQEYFNSNTHYLLQISKVPLDASERYIRGTLVIEDNTITMDINRPVPHLNSPTMHLEGTILETYMPQQALIKVSENTLKTIGTLDRKLITKLSTNQLE
ncbi:hypothetical protein NEOKW01_1462 [Nematocida sp. AWRm80]|nr:hypothetical protein NEOKW01_1462 [Nematocida sp. AWRm80]